MIPANVLFENLVLLEHHIGDAQEAMEEGDNDVLDASLSDMHDIIDELKSYLPKGLALEVEAREMGIPDDMEEIARNMLDD